MMRRSILMLAALAMPAAAMAQPTPGLSSQDPFGTYIPNMAIYCANASGAAVICGDPTADAALGTPADTAWAGTGPGTSIALAKALYGALQANTAVNNSFTTVVSTPTPGGASVTAGRAIMMACTATGNVVLNLSGSGSLTYPIVAAPSVAIQPFAVVSIASSGGGTTATCSFTDLN